MMLFCFFLSLLLPCVSFYLYFTTGATVYDLLHHQTDDLMMLHVPLTVRNNSTLHEAAYKMLANHIHRLWVVSPASNEVRLENLGVLTLTDILRAVYIAER